jgi:transcriptional regulator with PAS, ATPase and Fis domain
MSLLKSIRSELHHIIESIHAIINIDITIVDNNLERIVATNLQNINMGKTAPKNSAFHQCLTTGQQYFIENPRNASICIDCYNRENCKELVEICIPITFNQKIIGVLGMCAFDESAKNYLLSNQGSFLNLQNQLSQIISTILNEKNIGMQLKYRSAELITLINSINEGIIIFNKERKILNTNNYINEKLGVKSSSLPTIEEILSPEIYNTLEKKNFIGEIGPVTLKGFTFIINSYPININDKQKKDTILVFTDYNKMKESVLKSEKDKNLITFRDIVGESEALVYARQQAIQVAQKDVSVMLIGETGTGKEIFARAIHTLSQRKNDIFVPINCGAIPETLIESELFGYEKGSFTGASSTGKKGKFEIASQGTLFLDEIGDLGFSMQVKLLRALEEKEITRVGSNTSIRVNPRIISATHKDIHNMINKNTFRMDLFYRLNVVPIYIPPLRERGFDIIILARHFLSHFSKVYKKDITGFTQECERFLMSYSFPGNIRELRNLIEYAIIFEENSVVGVENISKKVGISVETENISLAEMTKRYEKNVIQNKLKNTGNDLDAKQQIAKQLGISIATLYRKLEG